jgi:probable HAF family extracellular repeat protein
LKLAPRIALTTVALAATTLAQANTLTLSSQFGLGTGFEAHDINVLGQVVGIDGTANAVALWQAGGFTNLATSLDTVEVVGINNNGAVLFDTVGASGNPSYQLYANGSSTAVTSSAQNVVLNGLNDAQTLVGYGISGAGVACGASIAGGATGTACVSGADAAYMAINNRGDKVLTTINGSGTVQSFLEASNGTRTSLGAMTSVAGINDSGAVAGVVNGHAVMVANGASTDMLSSVSGASSVKVYDINNAGQVVGQYNDANGNTVAFLWGSDGLTQIDSFLQGQGLQRVGNSAIGLNDLGQMVLTVYDGQAQDMATVVAQSTVPEPATYALMGLGLVGLSLVGCRRK